MQEKSIPIPKTHSLKDLLNLLVPIDSALAQLRRGLISLTRYAVEYRYPGVRANTRHMQVAIRRAEAVRAEIRKRLGLLF
jgi:HEPN domain-containing protein